MLFDFSCVKYTACGSELANKPELSSQVSWMDLQSVRGAVPEGGDFARFCMRKHSVVN